MVRWKTTLLTVLAFVAVIALLVVMMAFVNGMYQLTDSSGNPANVVVLSEGATDETFSNLQFADAGEMENHSSVARDNGRPMCSRETYLVVNQPIPDARPGRPKRRFLQFRGLDDPALSAGIHDLQLYAGGSWFSQAGVRQLPGSGTGDLDKRARHRGRRGRRHRSRVGAGPQPGDDADGPQPGAAGRRRRVRAGRTSMARRGRDAIVGIDF